MHRILRYSLLVLLYLCLSKGGYAAATDSVNVKRPRFYLGPGIGMDHGGIGLQFQYMPIKWAGVFVSGGTNISGINYAVGARLSASVDNTLGFYAVASYGFNGTLFSFRNTGIFDNVNSKGFVAGGGIELNFKDVRLDIGALYTKRETSDYRVKDISFLNAISIGLKYPLQF